MAVSGRVDDVILHLDGRVEVKYTEGVEPLPLAWGGEAVIYPSRVDFVLALQETETSLLSTLKLIQLAAGYKTDPTLGSGFLTRVEGKTTTLDLAGLAVPIKVG